MRSFSAGRAKRKRAKPPPESDEARFLMERPAARPQDAITHAARRAPRNVVEGAEDRRNVWLTKPRRRQAQRGMGGGHHVHPLAVGAYAYLVVVLDWHSRYVLAWELSNTLDAVFCVRLGNAGTQPAGNLQHRPRRPVRLLLAWADAPS